MTTSVNGTALILGCCFLFFHVMTVHGVLPNNMVYEMCFLEKYEEDFLHKEGISIGFPGELQAMEESSNWIYRVFDLKVADDSTGIVYYATATCDKGLSKAECEECLDMSRKFLEEDCGRQLGARVHLRDCGIRYHEYDYLE